MDYVEVVGFKRRCQDVARDLRKAERALGEWTWKRDNAGNPREKQRCQARVVELTKERASGRAS